MRHDHYLLDESGEAYPFHGGIIEWARLMTDGMRRVASDIIEPGGAHVSTVFLGSDHQWGHGPPLVFETMVFASQSSCSDLYCERYSTRAEALAGHAATVAKVAELATAGRDIAEMGAV